ncbi:MAG: diaminopimelate epimerase [Polyangiaceae bacterium]|nr:diaminopimelate epimerase [Polyangiaceae bacterium]
MRSTPNTLRKSTIKFTKFHGAGNDFILITVPKHLSASQFADAIQPICAAICNRHTGIGADGIIILRPEPSSHARMIIFNQDGSRPEICGNALRCAALHYLSPKPIRNTIITHKPTDPTINTDVGPKLCIVELIPNSPEANVTSTLNITAPPEPRTLTIKNHVIQLYTVSVGNPHAVMLNPPSELEFNEIAPLIATHPSFPNGTNVSFAICDAAFRTISSTNPDPTNPNPPITTIVWERGVGRTLACGTAACAVAAVAGHTRLVERAHTIQIVQSGGTLDVRLANDNAALVTGPARFVFSGSFHYSDFVR